MFLLADHFFWEKSEKDLSLYAHLWQQHIVLCGKVLFLEVIVAIFLTLCKCWTLDHQHSFQAVFFPNICCKNGTSFIQDIPTVSFATQANHFQGAEVSLEEAIFSFISFSLYYFLFLVQLFYLLCSVT